MKKKLVLFCMFFLVTANMQAVASDPDEEFRLYQNEQDQGMALAEEEQGLDSFNPGVEYAHVASVIPIQGKLTDDSGSPLNGTYIITARMYDSSFDGTVLCEDDDSVTVENGLFNMEMDFCTSSDIDGQRLYLGITVGSDPEMSPRQTIYPVPLAYSLRPAAIINGETSVAILHIENTHASGRGLRAYAMSETGTNYGVIGASRSPDGYGGYFYNNGGGTGLFSKAITTTGIVYGIHGESEADQGRGVYGEASNPAGGIGVEGSSIAGTGVYGSSESGYGIYGNTDSASRNYGIYTEDNLYASAYHLSGAILQIVQNGGEEALEPGDVAAFSGMGTPLVENGAPVIQVAPTTTANSTAVAGVVQSRYNIEATINAAEPYTTSSIAALDITPEGPIAPGEYLLMVVHGPVQVKATAFAKSIQPGDLLSTAATTGFAAKASQLDLGGVQTAIPGTVIGKALEPLTGDKELIHIFVTLN